MLYYSAEKQLLFCTIVFLIKGRYGMHSLLIFNPVSGKKEGRLERLGNLITGLTEQGEELTVYQTREKGDGERYLAEHGGLSYDRVICCGGDGTLHEVINGMMKNGSRIPIGYVPTGSTNDYAKNLGITKDTALQCIKEGTPTSIDVGCVNGEYFNYVAAFGAFTNVSFVTPQQWKNTLGYFAYLLEGIKQLTDIAPKKIRFSVDGGEWQESEVILGMITNSFSVAGIKNFQKQQVQLDDGKMEYLFIKFPRNLLELQQTITALLGEKIEERYMHYGQFSGLQLESEGLEWTLDGENGGCVNSTEILTCPGAVRILC